ncbi:MAG TPA: glycogen/starch/alpha-glucan phosphorylase, partial [Clostridia bacterium]|nr:glycogen/starch/alpha-glucan phosphorylase [Clostridia bacterium]
MELNVTSIGIREEIIDKLQRHFGRDHDTATKNQMYRAICYVLRDIMAEMWVINNSEDQHHTNKEVIYLSMEFLPGTSLRNNLFNLKLSETFSEAVSQLGFDISDIESIEPDAGLGNGGLGRLASCYLDAIASLGMSGHGMSICYEYGIFKQKIIDGKQQEMPDDWLTLGDVWLLKKDDEAEEVHFGGKLEEIWKEDGKLKVIHKEYTTVIALPRDMLISGYDSEVVNTLRLWESTSPITIDMKLFAEGNYLKSMEEKHMAEVISKILYPEDAHQEGKILRMKQQYFFISASMQHLVKKHLRQYNTLDNFSDKIAIHINDTHPTMSIPELIRIFVDIYNMDWDKAWDIVKRCVSYTNHTVMPEALECWPLDFFRDTLPRIYSIILEINRRQSINLMQSFPKEESLRNQMAIINNGYIHMANLCVEASHTVNGVSSLHSEIIKKELFPGFAKLTPNKFTNVTNGIAYRRWLCQSNPGLATLIEELIGKDFLKDATKLDMLLKYKDDSAVLFSLEQIKRHNKEELSKYVKNSTGIIVDPSSIFDVQAKRLHEYKRQLLNIFHIIYLYQTIKANPNFEFEPRTFFFAAKASAGYYMAKEIIKLINSVSSMLEKDATVKDRIRVVFLENYSVSLSEKIMPAAEVSEQISLAGKEASGTGNMKLMVNGALTIGTLDGANVEIHNEVGDENIFIFGMSVNEVNDLYASGTYSPWNLMHRNSELAEIMQLLSFGIDGSKYSDLFNSLTTGKNGMADQYFVLKDFDSYKKAQDKVNKTYLDRTLWNHISLINIANSGIFSADRAISDYAENIW